MRSGIILAWKTKVLKSVKMWGKCEMFEVEFFFFFAMLMNCKMTWDRPHSPAPPPVLAHVSMLMGQLLTWASLLLRGFPEDLRLLGAQRPQASQLLRQLRVGQRQVHPVGKRGRGRRAVKHFIAAWAQRLVFSHGLSIDGNESEGPTERGGILHAQTEEISGSSSERTRPTECAG